MFLNHVQEFQWLTQRYKSDTLASQCTPGSWPEAVGSWWDAQHQIDVVAVSYQQRIA